LSLLVAINGQRVSLSGQLAAATTTVEALLPCSAARRRC
jgi:hypothetical protein